MFPSIVKAPQAQLNKQIFFMFICSKIDHKLILNW